jgi:hypothetical protein
VNSAEMPLSVPTGRLETCNTPEDPFGRSSWRFWDSHSVSMGDTSLL